MDETKDVAPKKRGTVTMKVAQGRSLVLDRHPQTGFHNPAKKPGELVELDAAEAERLKKLGVVIEAHEALPPRPPIGQPQGPDFAEGGEKPAAKAGKADK